MLLILSFGACHCAHCVLPQARVLSLNADTGAVAALDHLYLLSSLPAASSGKTNANKNSNKNNKQKKNKSKDEGIDEEAVGEVIVDAARGVIYAHTLAVPPQDLQRAPKVHHLHDCCYYGYREHVS